MEMERARACVVREEKAAFDDQGAGLHIPSLRSGPAARTAVRRGAERARRVVRRHGLAAVPRHVRRRTARHAPRAVRPGGEGGGADRLGLEMFRL